jgi:hypothetical protein
MVLCVTSAVGSEFAVAGPFEAFVRVGGDEVRGGLADLSLDLLRRCAPVRRPGVYQRQRHMPGLWFSTTVWRFLEYESLLERDWMVLLDFDHGVEWICEQPLRLRYRKDERPASRVPDLLVWRAGTPELCDVKSAERLEDCEFRAQVQAMELACAEAGLGFWPCRIASCWRMCGGSRGFRGRPPDPDGERARMLSMLAGGASTVGELLAGAHELMLARPMLMHLLWTGEALTDLAAPVGEDSRVWGRLRVAA